MISTEHKRQNTGALSLQFYMVPLSAQLWKKMAHGYLSMSPVRIELKMANLFLQIDG